MRCTRTRPGAYRRTTTAASLAIVLLALAGCDLLGPDGSGADTGGDPGAPGNPPPEPITGPFTPTFSVVDAESGSEIPFLFVRRAFRGDGGSWSTSYGFDRVVINAPGVHNLETLNAGDEFDLEIRSFGYRMPEIYAFTAEDLHPHRDRRPSVELQLQPEEIGVALTYTGEAPVGTHSYEVGLTESGFVDETVADLGAGPGDIYSFFLGFKLLRVGPNPNPLLPGTTATIVLAPDTAPGRLADAPYDPNVAQPGDEYLRLRATFTVADDVHAVIQDGAIDKLIEVYVEMLVLEGDGGSTIDGDEAFIGFVDARLFADTHQIEIR